MFDAESELFFAHVWKCWKEGVASTSRSSPLLADKREVQSDLNSDGRGGAVFDFCLLFVLPLFLRPHHINPQETREEKGRGGRGGEDELGLQGRRRVLAGGVKEGGEAKNTSLAAALPLTFRCSLQLSVPLPTALLSPYYVSTPPFRPISHFQRRTKRLTKKRRGGRSESGHR